ncbi:MAG: thiamine diphosphokinase [Lachnospiraceae bacterium]|nr:thiamine diphosphokinase [Lachnospiraceae bacterium]
MSRLEACKKAVIISGGRIDRDFALRCLREEKESQIIAADRGLVFCRENGIRVDCIVGDFDSAGAQILEEYEQDEQVLIRRFQPEKDWTDTQIAVSLAAQRGCRDITILGGTGTRLDHVLGNIQVLNLLMQQGIEARILDPYNRIRLIDGPLTLKKSEQWGSYVSLLSYDGPVRGLTLTGFKYGLEDFTLDCVGSLGISNEIEQEEAKIRFEEGILLVIESSDTPRW